MRATYDRKSLLAAFGMVAGVAPARSPRPILSNCKLIACPEHGSTLMATDGEIGIRHRVLGGTVREAGAAILPTAKMQAILSTSNDAELDIEVEGETLIVRGQHAKFKLPSEDPDAFPDVPKFEAGANCFRLNPEVFAHAIERTVFCTDVQSTRYALGGVLVSPSKECCGFDLVATDGRRLAVTGVGTELVGEPTYDGTAVLPVKALKLLLRCIGGDALMGAAFDKQSAMFRTEDATIYTRLVEGRFPRYQDVFPPTAEARIELEVGPLLSAVEQAAILTSDQSRGVDFEFAGDRLSLTTSAAEVGSASVELPIVYGRDPVGITFDPRYLTDALKVLDPASRVTAELIDGKSAAVFVTEDGYKYVIMPLTRDR